MNLTWTAVVLIVALLAAGVALILAGHTEAGTPLLTADVGLIAGALGGAVHRNGN